MRTSSTRTATAQDAPEISPLINDPDVDNYDGCYLPDDRIIFCSTASITGVPCINGSGHVCNLYIKELDGSIRQLTIEQDHDWNPTVMNNGRVMYLRWEYVDLPHAFAHHVPYEPGRHEPVGTLRLRLLLAELRFLRASVARRFHSSSSESLPDTTNSTEWATSLSSTPREEGKKRQAPFSASPAGKDAEPIACDLPIAQNWPKFLHPFPISETLFLVS